MLVLMQKVGETVMIDGGIEVRVLRVVGNKVKMGFTAPRDVTILREKLIKEKDNGEDKL